MATNGLSKLRVYVYTMYICYVYMGYNMERQLTQQVLYYERLSEKDLLEVHMYWINECAKLDLWKDISDTHAYKMREMLGAELRIRMNAE